MLVNQPFITIIKKIKGRKYPLLDFHPTFSEDEGEIVGIFAGDGSQYFEPNSYSYRVNIHFGVKNLGYAQYVEKLFENYFGKNFILSKPYNGTIRVYTKSKDVFNYFHHYLDFVPQLKHSTVKLRTLDLPPHFKIGLLRGLFDTDGSVRYNNHDKGVKIMLNMTSQQMITQVKAMLDEFDLKCGQYVYPSSLKRGKLIHSVQVWKRDSNKFLNLVNPYKRRLL